MMNKTHIYYGGLYMNYILLIIGLIICFGGIYLRKPIFAITGLFWGAAFSFIVLLLIAGLWDMDESSLIIVIFSALLCAVFSVVYEKICVFINSFMSTFIIISLLVMILSSSEINGIVICFIAAIIATLIGMLSVHIYQYSFSVITAFTGAFVSSVSLQGIVRHTDALEIVARMIWRGDSVGPVIIMTFILGIVGICVQTIRFNSLDGTKDNATSFNSIFFSIAPFFESLANALIAFINAIFNFLYPIFHTIKSELASETACSLLVLFGFIVLPIANNCDLWYGAFSYYVNRLYLNCEMAAYATILYYGYFKKIELGVVLCSIPCLITLFAHHSLLPYSFFSVLFQATNSYVIFAGILRIKKYENTGLKYLYGILFTVLYKYLLLRWIITKQINWSIYQRDITPILIFVGTFTFLIWYKQKINILNIADYINQKANRRIISNIHVFGLASLIVICSIGSIKLYEHMKYLSIREQSAAGQHKQSTADTNSITSQTDDNSENLSMPFLVDYIGMTVNDITNLYGKDIQYLDYWVGGNAKPFYYDDARVPYIFYYIDSELKGNASGDEKITLIQYNPSGNNSLIDTAKGIPAVVTYSQLQQLEYRGTFMDEKTNLLQEYGETGLYTLQYDAQTSISFYWFDHVDPFSHPAEMIILTGDVEYKDSNGEPITTTDTSSDEVSNLPELLTSEPWEVYCAYNFYTNEPEDITSIYSRSIVRGENYLIFNEDGTFVWSLGTYTSNYKNNEMTGIYECDGNSITLYSDTDSGIIQMEYTDLDCHSFVSYPVEEMSLYWEDIINGSEGYSVYFVHPSFYQ